MPKKKRVVKRNMVKFIRDLKKVRKNLKASDLDGLRRNAHAMIDAMYSDEILMNGCDLFIKTLEVMVVLGDDYEDFIEMYKTKIIQTMLPPEETK